MACQILQRSRKQIGFVQTNRKEKHHDRTKLSIKFVSESSSISFVLRNMHVAHHANRDGNCFKPQRHQRILFLTICDLCNILLSMAWMSRANEQHMMHANWSGAFKLCYWINYNCMNPNMPSEFSKKISKWDDLSALKMLFSI